MPDQYDPKQAPRSPIERRAAEQRAAPQPTDDPLAELARMVHGRPPQGSAAARTAGRAVQAPPATTDLESELLNDLQASFAAVREAAALPAGRVQPYPVAAAPVSSPAPQLVEPPRSRPAAVAPEPAYPPPSSAPAGPVREELRADFRVEPLDESRLVPIPRPPVIRPSMPPGLAERLADQRAALEGPFSRLVERSPRPAEPQAEDDEFSAFELRPTTAPPAPEPAPSLAPSTPPPRAASRWEKPQAAQASAPPPPASRFAPPQGPRVRQPEPEEGDADLFGESGLFPPPVAEETEFPDGEFGLAPDYADDDVDDGGEDLSGMFPPLDDGPGGPRKARAPMPRAAVVVAAVVAIALVGGIAVAMFRTGQNSASAPPTILADGGPVKVTPDPGEAAPASNADAQNKLIYDRVNSAAANNDTTLLTPDAGPLRDTTTPDDGNAISRVILPGGPGYDTPAPSGDAPPAAGAPVADADTVDALGPRKVRTVVVKPDGTILSSSATDAPAGDAAAHPAAAPQTTAAAPPAAAPATAAPAPVTDDMAAIAGTGDSALSITTTPDGTGAPAIPAAPAAAPTPAPAPVIAAKPPAAAPAPKVAKVAPALAPVDANGPLHLTPGGPAGAAQPATATDGMFVQISSQHTEDAARATYKDLQTRYPSILGRYDVNLQQADVPARGTFYRVRVGPFSSADAQRLCDDLRSAGGDCVLAKR